jgi:hypothetical protein
MSKDEIRAKTNEIVDRLKSDAEFRRQVEKDPAGMLQAAGLSEELMSDFVGGFGSAADVEAHLPPGCTVTCVKQTSECLVSYLV